MFMLLYDACTSLLSSIQNLIVNYTNIDYEQATRASFNSKAELVLGDATVYE